SRQSFTGHLIADLSADGKGLEMSPPATWGPTFTGITGTQGPTRWREGGARRRRHRDGRA
ncbi:MAG: hypothetical protein ACLP1X_24665, partial [Polyangiaceae bacterium]